MKTGVKTIIAGAILFVLGAFVVPLAIILPLIFGDSNEIQFKVPGSTQIVIEEPGRYYMWNDYQTVFYGKSYNRSESIPDGIEIRIMNASTGELFDFVSDTSISSSRGSSSKNTIGYIEVQSPSTVEVEVAGGEEERVFSFSESNLLKMFGLILGGSILAVIIGITGFGITIWGIVKLMRSSKKGEQVASADAVEPCR
jgi:hypothetical protein